MPHSASTIKTPRDNASQHKDLSHLYAKFSDEGEVGTSGQGHECDEGEYEGTGEEGGDPERDGGADAGNM
ncbi:hypothetical protein L1987_02397 [Smallanthus sonchifolius]|uniref:Uncharacterized protein n=1 Tax=Smallanthus sonchifolius TaxID=185202 RepID=A0ACB9K7U5_9ASTR|nr:hypothetical protein L1987_02397 [Smallanthus sonchifolius]